MRTAEAFSSMQKGTEGVSFEPAGEIRTMAALVRELAGIALCLKRVVLAETTQEQPSPNDSEGSVQDLYEAFRCAEVHHDQQSFVDAYAQTVTYGLLCARWRIQDEETDRFGLESITGVLLGVSPHVSTFFERLLELRKNKAIGQVLEVLVHSLRQTSVQSILRNESSSEVGIDPLIDFYEAFLRRYDADQRKMRGVWYTPGPVVSSIVRAVDEQLRVDFGLTDGLADISTWADLVARHEGVVVPQGVSPGDYFVQILDPATGAGTFLVEVVGLIHRNLMSRWTAEGCTTKECVEQWNTYVPEHLLPRLYGYELMMAPYVAAHLQIAMKLHETGYRFTKNVGVNVLMTNALLPSFDGENESFEGLWADEFRRVQAVKATRRFTVILGNPPYSNRGVLNRNPWMSDLLRIYKAGLNEKKINLDDDFIQFVRLAHWHIQESGFGVVGLITNNVFFDGVTHRGMRKSLLDTFESGTFVDLHGSAFKDESTPGGGLDENVFDIKVGVGISVLSRGFDRKGRFRAMDVWGTCAQKIQQVQRLSMAGNNGVHLKPKAPWFFFKPRDSSDVYDQFVSVTDMFEVYQGCLKTDRDALVFDLDKDVLAARMEYVFSGRSDSDFRAQYRIESSSSYDIEHKLVASQYDSSNLRQCLRRPFDKRWLYYDKSFTSRPSWNAMKHIVDPGNIMLLTARQQSQSGEWALAWVADGLAECTVISNKSKEFNYAFPLYLRAGFEGGKNTDKNNFKTGILDKFSSSLNGVVQAEDLFGYIYAILHSREYRSRYAQHLRIDFPRVPIPYEMDLFQGLSQLGSQLISIHLLREQYGPLVMVGSGPTVVGKVIQEDETIWLSESRDCGFTGVPDEVWSFRSGCFSVIEHWLKNRKGRTLTEADLLHLGCMVGAIAETIRIAKSIECVIHGHGGWPRAFISDSESNR